VWPGRAGGKRCIMVSRQQAETALARVLLEHIRNDAYPSTTQMTMLEQVIPA